MTLRGEALVPVGHPREARRQQALLRALFAAAAPTEPPPALGTSQSGPQWAASLAAYRGNAAAHAAASLAASHPTVQAMLGGDAFSTIARRHWHCRPPRRGDLARTGVDFAATLAAEPQLRQWPWLADCARLDWARWEVQFDAPAAFGAADLESLTDADPAALMLRLAPATRLIASRWPVHALWQAHAAPEPSVAELRAAEARWLRDLSAGRTLGAAMDAAPADFDVAAWLRAAVTQGWLDGVSLVAARPATIARRP